MTDDAPGDSDKKKLADAAALKAPAAPKDDPTKPSGGLIDALDARTAKYKQQYDAALGPYESSAMKALSSPQAPPPQMQQIPKPPHPELSELVQGFLPIITAFAAFTGGRNQAAATAALTAAGAFTQGVQEGSAEKIKQAQEEWKTNVQAALDGNKQTMDQYRLIMEQRNTNVSEKLQALQIAASANNHEMMAQAAASHDIAQVLGIQRQMEDSQLKLKEYDLKVQQFQERIKEKGEQQARLKVGQIYTQADKLDAEAVRLEGLAATQDRDKPGTGAQYSAQAQRVQEAAKKYRDMADQAREKMSGMGIDTADIGVPPAAPSAPPTGAPPAPIAPPPAPPAAAPPQQAAIIDAAKKAIAAGHPLPEVIAALKARGIDPSILQSPQMAPPNVLFGAQPGATIH